MIPKCKHKWEVLGSYRFPDGAILYTLLCVKCGETKKKKVDNG